MKRLFSNGPSKDFVLNQFARLLHGSKRAYIAAPFVNKTDDVLAAAWEGTKVSLLGRPERQHEPASSESRSRPCQRGGPVSDPSLPREGLYF